MKKLLTIAFLATAQLAQPAFATSYKCDGKYAEKGKSKGSLEIKNEQVTFGAKRSTDNFSFSAKGSLGTSNKNWTSVNLSSFETFYSFSVSTQLISTGHGFVTGSAKGGHPGDNTAYCVLLQQTLGSHSRSAYESS